jgi:hypothetical protein
MLVPRPGGLAADCNQMTAVTVAATRMITTTARQPEPEPLDRTADEPERAAPIHAGMASHRNIATESNIDSKRPR